MILKVRFTECYCAHNKFEGTTVGRFVRIYVLPLAQNLKKLNNQNKFVNVDKKLFKKHFFFQRLLFAQRIHQKPRLILISEQKISKQKILFTHILTFILMHQRFACKLLI